MVKPRARRLPTSALAAELAPSAVAQQQVSRAPQFREGRRGRGIAHSELVATVNGSVAFVATPYQINPGNASLFPWLATQASSWEQYRFNRLRFRYITRLGTDKVGSVMMAIDYDASDLSPTTEAQLAQYEGASENNTWALQSMEAKVADMHAPGVKKFIRTAMVAGDLRNFDAGKFLFGTVAQADTAAVGKLWVDYDVDFFVPQLSPSDTSGPRSNSFFTVQADQTFATTVREAVDFVSVYDPLNFGAQAAGLWTPPAGVYRLDWNAAFADTSAENFTVSVELLKNGASLAEPLIVADKEAAIAAGYIAVSGHWIVTCSGTDTIQLAATLTGAAGTLTCFAHRGQIIFQAA